MSNPHSGQWSANGPDGKELFAYFGRCAYYSQVLEQGFVNLSAGLRVAGLSSVTVGQIRDAYEFADKKTMGQLITDARKHNAVPAEVESAIQQALEDRNYLCHSFFVTHDEDSCTPAGRAAMVAELETMTDRFINVDKAVDAIWRPLWTKFGITEDHIEAHVRRRLREAAARDGLSNQPHGLTGTAAADTLD